MIPHKVLTISMIEESYSKKEFEGQLNPVRDKLEEMIKERELKAKTSDQYPDASFIEKLIKIKHDKYQVEELIDSLQKMTESQFLENNSDLMEKYDTLESNL